MTKSFSSLAAGLVLAAILPTPLMAERVSVLVFDASGSMWNRVEGDLTRIEVARDVMGDFFASRDGAVPLSVIAYGHNRRGDCADIEVVAPMGQTAPSALEARLRGLMPRGMTPLTDSLALARGQLPQTAEAADIILVTDGLETCAGDPCALAAELAAEGIDIRAHVVGFGLTRLEVEALSCITDQTGGLLFQTNSGAELADALRQVSAVEPAPEPQPASEPTLARVAAFDIGDKAEAGFAYPIGWTGEATFVDYMGFVPQGETSAAVSPSYGVIGGTSENPNNPATRTAPTEPGMYDLIVVSASDGVIARQAVEVVPPSIGFEPIGSVEPGSRVRFAFRGPERLEERIVIADLDQPVNEHQRHGWAFALHKNGATTLRVPAEPGEYEVRYLNRSRSEILFSRRFGVGIPFEDADLTTSADLAAQAAAATQGDPLQDSISAVSATFRLPPGLPDSAISWDGIPLDPDMQPEAWAPMDTGPVISGAFEPGTWRITARAPGEVEFTADVMIFPGQDNNFVLTLVQDGAADGPLGALDGRWSVWAIPPRDSGAEPPLMMTVTLQPTAEGQDYTGGFSTDINLGGVMTQGDLSSVIIEEDTLLIEFPIPQLEPGPFRLALSPQGAGFVGTLAAGANVIPVALWPEGMAPDLSLWHEAAAGPVPQDELMVQDIAFVCSEPRCEVAIDGLAVALEQGWAMTPPVWTSATAAAHPLDQPRVDFIGPDDATLHLNPHQWLADNGPCMPTAAGDLCLWRDGPAHAAAAAVQIAMSLRLEDRDAAVQPEGPVSRQAEAGPDTVTPPTIETGSEAFFADHGPYLAGAEVYVFAQRGQDRRPGDQVVLLRPDLQPVAQATARWLDDHRAGLQMPDAPGPYRLAVFDSAAGSLRAVTEIEVAADPQPVFARYNPNPRPGRSYGLVLRGRMALTDQVAVLTTPGDTVVEVGLYDALRGELRLPEGAFGRFDLVYRAHGRILQRVALDVGGPPVLAPAGGSDGPAELTMTGTLTPGGKVEVSVRGMIPADLGTVGFIAVGSPDLTILQTGTRVSPADTAVSVTVPDGDGPWALRLVDQNLIRVAEILPEATPGQPSATALTPVTLPEGMTADDVLDHLLPGFKAE